MERRPDTLRKAIEDQGKRAGFVVNERVTADRKAVIAESKDNYRSFVDNVNRTSDLEIERALRRA